MTSTKFSISAAARLTGKSRTTLSGHIKAGKLSCETDANGNKVIDASELARVYPDEFDPRRGEANGKSSGSVKGTALSSDDQSLHSQLNSVQQQLDAQLAERERERRQLQQQIDQLTDSLKLAQEGANKAMLLLQDRTGAGAWQEAINSLETRIATQEKTAEQLARLKTDAKNEALREIKGKYWWQVAFSK